jgi:hypothetical protein
MCEHLRSIGCDWNEQACLSAAANGKLDTLRWLREHGCPWNVNEVCIDAAYNGYVDILD